MVVASPIRCGAQCGRGKVEAVDKVSPDARVLGQTRLDMLLSEKIVIPVMVRLISLAEKAASKQGCPWNSCIKSSDTEGDRA